MRKSILIVYFVFLSLPAAAQSYQELSEQALKYAEQDSVERAEELFRQAMKLEPANPKNALIFSNIGTLQKQKGLYEQAAESYTYALSIAPSLVPVLLNRASVYMEQKLHNRAYADYCQVLDADAKNPEALLMRAYIYMLRRDYKAARIDYDRLQEINSENYSARLGLATLNQKEQKYREAFEILEKLIVEYPEDAALYVARAGVEYDMDLIDMALPDLETAIRLDPSLAEAFLLRGEIYLARKQKKLAKQDFEKARDLGIPQIDLRDRIQKCR